MARIFYDSRTLTDDGVERGPDGAPIAFRIWRAGSNPTDKGDTVFSPRSAEFLMADQAKRGNLYSIDVDHLSVLQTAPPESRKAVGWHRLEVRGGELWAVDVKWTDAVREGLKTDPPEWRYFSPAYVRDDKSSEVLAYLNTALTNNPATWNVAELAQPSEPKPAPKASQPTKATKKMTASKPRAGAKQIHATRTPSIAELRRQLDTAARDLAAIKSMKAPTATATAPTLDNVSHASDRASELDQKMLGHLQRGKGAPYTDGNRLVLTMLGGGQRPLMRFDCSRLSDRAGELDRKMLTAARHNHGVLAGNVMRLGGFDT
jgi:hypothetical protein